jgi:hypothetical protein
LQIENLKFAIENFEVASESAIAPSLFALCAGAFYVGFDGCFQTQRCNALKTSRPIANDRFSMANFQSFRTMHGDRMLEN